MTTTKVARNTRCLMCGGVVWQGKRIPCAERAPSGAVARRFFICDTDACVERLLRTMSGKVMEMRNDT